MNHDTNQGLGGRATPPDRMPMPEGYRLQFFSALLDRVIVTDAEKRRIGKLTDMVFRLSEPFPEAVGLYVEHGKGLPSELIPWDRVVEIDDAAIVIAGAEGGGPYPPFVDQKGWILLNEHLMGRTVLDIDGRRTEVVNDIHLLHSRGRMILVHVDISFNGFFRRWHLPRLVSPRDRLISWRYVQPFSLEDGVSKDVVTLSVTREHAMELPSEDLADALEVLSGDEQKAMFSALDPEKAAGVLVEAEPRAKRQLIAFLREEKARLVLARMSAPQIADLLSSLPHEKVTGMLQLLPLPRAARVKAIMSDAEGLASTLMSEKYLSFTKEIHCGDILRILRSAPREHRNISYLYIVAAEDRTLLGVVDLRDLVAAREDTRVGDLMVSPVVSAELDSLRADLEVLFAKYQFRMLPIVDAHDHLWGIVRNRDITKGSKAESS